MSDQETHRNDENAELINTDKENTFAGLKNQGATCYMNSLLQALYHLPAFRRVVYKMPTTGNEDINTNVALNLQRLFALMQFSDLPCSTKALTKSFGWNDEQTFMQHDLQEFSRVLIDNLETKLKGDPELKDSISNIFRGQYISFIRCKNVKYESSKNEDFYDLTLQVKGISNLEESFVKYTEKEQLVGDNQYRTDEHGLQDAEMGVEFTKFPSVLHLHLGRFEYDPETDQMMKINDKFEFPESINLAPFLSPNSDHSQQLMYDLYGVLVHMGNVYSGHYYAFLRTSTDPQWFKFDDNNVTKASSNDAIEDNFGEDASNSRNDPYKQNFMYSNYPYYQNYNYGNNYNYANFGKKYSAYMLVYVCRAEASRIMAPVTLSDIPRHLQQYAEKKIQMIKRRKEIKNDKRNNHTFIILRTEDIKKNTLMGIDIYNPPFLTNENLDIYNQHFLQPNSPIILNDEEKDQNNYRYDLLSNMIFKIPINKATSEIYKMVSNRFDVPKNEIRIWYQEKLQNRLKIVNNNQDQYINNRTVQSNILFYQHKEVDDVVSMKNSERFIFVKYYFPDAELPIQFIGSYVVKTTQSFSDFCIQINEELGIKLEENDKMLIYRQYNDVNNYKPNEVQIIPNHFTMDDVPSGVFIFLQIDPTLNIDEYYKWSKGNDKIDPIDADYDEKLRVSYEKGDSNHKNLIDEIRKKMKEKRDRVYSIRPSKFKLQEPEPIQSFIINENAKEDSEIPKNQGRILKEVDIFPRIATIYPFYILEKYSKVEIDIYNYEQQGKLLFTIETFMHSTIQRLKRLIAHGINEDYNPNKNAIILYIVNDPNFYVEQNPNAKPNGASSPGYNIDDENDDKIALSVFEMQVYQNYNVSNLYPRLDTNLMNKNLRLYFLMMKNVDENQAKYLHQYTVQVSFDGINVQEEHKMMENQNTEVKVLYDSIKSMIPKISELETQFLDQMKSSDKSDYDITNKIFRFYEVSNHVYTKKLELTSCMDFYSAQLRIDYIPEDQRNLNEDEKLIQVAYLRQEEYTRKLEYDGNPFFIVIKKGEAFGEIKKRIIDKVEDKNEINCFYIRVKDQYSGYVRREIKDDVIVSDIIDPKSRIYIYHKTKGGDNSSIKIYN